ncbi:MAG: metallophosphoesterase family protein [Planctomycetota bacterium]
MSGRTIANGDIHGCHAALQRILNPNQPTFDDTIVTMGDVVDRGPQSREVIDSLIRLAQQTNLVSLSGNHELMMLAAIEEPSELHFWIENGGYDTVESYGSLEAIPREHLEFLRGFRPYFETRTHFFVHANYSPHVPLAKQPDFAMYWEHLSAHTPGPHDSGKTAIVGHTPQRRGAVLDYGHLVCIDTFCYGKGCLTAFDVHTKQVWQATKTGEDFGASEAK